MRYSKRVVRAAICAILSFWIAETALIAFGFEGYPDVFITCWYSFWAVELAALAGIKISETKNKIDDIAG